jgi:hypothetical protein
MSFVVGVLLLAMLPHSFSQVRSSTRAENSRRSINYTGHGIESCRSIGSIYNELHGTVDSTLHNCEKAPTSLEHWKSEVWPVPSSLLDSVGSKSHCHWRTEEFVTVFESWSDVGGLVPKSPRPPQTILSSYAAKTAAGAGLGSHGPGIGGTNRAMSSDPQSPQRRPDDVETVSQFSQ